MTCCCGPLSRITDTETSNYGSASHSKHHMLIGFLIRCADSSNHWPLRSALGCASGEACWQLKDVLSGIWAEAKTYCWWKQMRGQKMQCVPWLQMSGIVWRWMAVVVCSSVTLMLKTQGVKHRSDCCYDSYVVSRGLLATCSPLLIGLSNK